MTKTSITSIDSINAGSTLFISGEKRVAVCSPKYIPKKSLSHVVEIGSYSFIGDPAIAALDVGNLKHRPLSGRTPPTNP
ncbi:unnamed protein product [Sphagnum tenellum]